MTPREWKRRRRRERAIIALIIAVALAIIFGIIVLCYRYDQSRRAECEATGGRVIEVHGTRDQGWMCWR